MRCTQAYGLEPEDWNKSALTVVVVGASGDLARKKIFPALFALYHEGMLPEVSAAMRSPCGSAVVFSVYTCSHTEMKANSAPVLQVCHGLLHVSDQGHSSVLWNTYSY